MSGSINTTTDATPDDSDRSYGWVVAVLVFLASPAAVLAGIGTWMVFSYMHVRRSVIASFLGIYLLLVAALSFLLVPLFISAYSVTLPALVSQKIDILPGILLFLIKQVPLTLPIGVIAGLAYSTYRWVTRPVWDEVVFRVTPWEALKRKRHVENIENDREGPENGVTLGVTKYGDKIIQTDEEASAHTLVVGASGSGKTTTLMSKARDAIRRGHGFIFIDLKGGPDVPDILAKYAKRYDRKFSHWLMQSRTEEYTGPDPLGPAYYDPIARGEATRRKDLIIASREWSEEFYKNVASDYLQMAFYILIGNPNEKASTFSDIVSLLDPKVLLERATPLGSDPRYQEIVAGVEALNDSKIPREHLSAISGLRSQLSNILRSVAGSWLQVDKKGDHNIDLRRAAQNGEVVVFSLDGQNYEELSGLIANLIIQDLKTLSSELINNPIEKPCQVFIDEFSTIGSENIIGLINKSRAANLPVTLSTQARGDLLRVDSTFAGRILAIINCFIIHGSAYEDDLEVYSSLTGKTMRKKFRQSVEHTSNFFGLGRGSGSGSGTVEDVEEFVVMPQSIRSLGTGELIYIANSTKRVEQVKVIREKNESTSGFNNPAHVATPKEVEEILTVPTSKTGTEESLPSLQDIIATKPQDNLQAEPFLPGVEKTVPKPSTSAVGPLATDFNKGFKPTAKPVFPQIMNNPFREEDVADTESTLIKNTFPSAASKTNTTTSVKPIKVQPVAQPDPFKITKPSPLAQPKQPANTEGQKLQPKTPRPPRKKDEFDF